MQHANLYKRSSILIACIGALFISGCSSPKTAVESPQTKQASASLSDEELAQLKASSQQWQAAKAGVERLLVIEQDLKLLISQLNAVANQGSASTNTPPVPTAKASTETVAPKVAQKAKVATNTADEKQAIKALFALQVAAVTDKDRLSQSLYEIKASASSLFEGEFVANVETINVSGMTYYRLKLGAYQNQANAAADCDKLKQRQINCIVSHYTQQPLK